MKKPSGKLVVALGAIAAPTVVGAFGLGEARVDSAFGQPLEVRIPLTLERAETLSRLRVEFAAPATYIDAGLEWPVILARTEISFQQDASGAWLRIHSDQRVMEPILPLLLEARLGPTSIRREYAVLLDLPSAQARPQVAAAAAAPRPFVAPAPAEASAPEAPAAATPSAAPESAPSPAAKPARRAAPSAPAEIIGTTRVLEGETLGTLAQRVRPDPRIPLRRMMKAIYDANPGAFSSQDLMWSGSEIRVPAVGQFRTPRAEASHPVPKLSAEAPAAWTLPHIPGRPALKFISTLTPPTRLSLQVTSALSNPPPVAGKPIVASPAPEPAAAPVQETAAPAPAVQLKPATSTRVASRTSGISYWALALLGLLGFAAFRLFGNRLRTAWTEWRELRAAAEQESGTTQPAVAPSLPAAPASPTPRARPVEVAPAEPRAAERLMSVATEPAAATQSRLAADAAALEAAENPAPAAEEATPAPAPAPAAKIVPIKRREEHAIEVVEAPAHAATGTDGGLNGFYADVAQMLTTALEQDPRRRDLRLKLLEVYFSAGLADEYLTQTRAYLDELRGQNDESWADVAEMGRKLVPGHEWFAMSTPPRLAGAGESQARASGAASRRTFNRYYEGVDQWRLRGALEDLNQTYQTLTRDTAFAQSQTDLLQKLAGRPTLLVHAAGLSQRIGGAQIYLKREPRHGSGDDHLINAIGQCALARRMGRKSVVAATSNGLHGLAVAAVARSLGLECRIYMVDKDVRAHFPRVLKMREFGATVEEVHENKAAPGELDVRRAALTAWLERPKDSMYISSLSSGPHPYPMMMHNSQAVVGRELRAQMNLHSPRPPAAIVAGTADGPGVIGLLHSFIDETQTRLYCVETSRIGSKARHEAVDLEQTEHNWPREHNWLKETKRVTYGKVTEAEAILAMQQAYETEKLMLSQEGAQVVAFASRVAKELRQDQTVALLLPSQNDADARLMENASTRQIRIDVA